MATRFVPFRRAGSCTFAVTFTSLLWLVVVVAALLKT